MYINRTGINSPIGKIVKLDSDPRGVLLALPADTSVLGVVVGASFRSLEVAQTGIQRVFICNKFSNGDTVYLRKYNERGNNGECYAASAPTVPYVKIGECLEDGSGRLARVRLSISYQVAGSLSGESDPVFVASAAHGVTSGKISNWDTAYGHSQAAHAPASAEQNVNADWNALSGDAQILNKPTISEIDYSLVIAYAIAL